MHAANHRRPAPVEKGAWGRLFDWLRGCWRTVIVLGLFGLLALILIGRAVQLQVSEQGFYVQQGGDRQQRLQVIPAHRGMITDRNGEPLAISVPMDAVWVNPMELTRFYTARNTVVAKKNVDQDPIKTLASLLSIPEASLRSLVADNRSKQFIYVQRQVRPSVAAGIRAAKLPGVGLQREYQRFYPTGDVTASLIGFTNIDDHGQAGLEASYNNYLAGVAGRRFSPWARALWSRG